MHNKAVSALDLPIQSPLKKSWNKNFWGGNKKGLGKKYLFNFNRLRYTVHILNNEKRIFFPKEEQ